MHYNYKYRLDPPEALTETLLHHVDTCRQLYNHVLSKLNEADEIPARYKVQGTLPDLKRWWDELGDVHSKVLQMVVKRVYDNLSTLKAQTENGRAVGMLKWKPPREYRSFTYNQSGFKLKNTSGRPVLWLSKIGEIPIHLHRDIPESATIKQVTVKQEPTGEWFATFGIDVDEDTPEKPENLERVAGIDVGILKYAHDTDGTAVESPDFSAERERLERAQRDLSRKEHGSNNWEKARQQLAQAYERLQTRREDYREKLAHEYTTQYDAVFLEDLDVKAMKEDGRNSRNIAAMLWRQTIQAFKRHGKKNGCYVIEVPPEGTTKRCSQCGCETDKPLWVREHSCPSCGFEADRDYNAALEIKRLGLQQLGIETPAEDVGQGMAESTPAETALSGDTEGTPYVVSPTRVVETGSPCLKEPPKAASRQG